VDRIRRAALGGRWLCLLIGCAAALRGGPPFQTDDPEPVPYHQYEAYVYSTLDRVSAGMGTQGPAAEFNWGAVPNLQLHIGVPMGASLLSGRHTFGLGDIEVGAKYRFLEEKDRHPQVSFYPLLELPTGRADKSLGNGQLWARLPVWIQKSFGPWTTYGGGGVVINNAPGKNNFPYGGWLVQRRLDWPSKKLTVGVELFAHGSPGLDHDDPAAAAMIDAGGSYNFKMGFSILAAAGHSIAGEPETYAYVGLYWIWGKSPPSRPVSSPYRP
jgi:hypothetical protein